MSFVAARGVRAGVDFGVRTLERRAGILTTPLPQWFGALQ